MRIGSRICLGASCQVRPHLGLVHQIGGSRGRRGPLLCQAEAGPRTEAAEASTSGTGQEIAGKRSTSAPDRQVSKFARGAASTFAPRASGRSKNPAYPGSTLYTIFEVQAWLSVVVGGLLSYNIIFPTDKPSIARLLGMWSIWMFTVPSLRARDCPAAEKDVLNILFLLIPIINVALPFVWKSFPFIFTVDVAALAGLYLWKMGLPGKSNNI